MVCEKGIVEDLKYVKQRFIAAGITMALLMLTLTGAYGESNIHPAGHSHTEDSVDFSLSPDPGFGPDQVVKIQLEALQHNDRGDGGIALNFRFSSPENKKSTGPIERFANIIKSPIYSPMINSLAIDYDAVEVRGDIARQRVTIIGKSGKKYTYVFYLSKQNTEPYHNCWMTDAVIVERVEDRSISV
jgi:hypothetical protein